MFFSLDADNYLLSKERKQRIIRESQKQSVDEVIGRSSSKLNERNN